MSERKIRELSKLKAIANQARFVVESYKEAMAWSKKEEPTSQHVPPVMFALYQALNNLDEFYEETKIQVVK